MLHKTSNPIWLICRQFELAQSRQNLQRNRNILAYKELELSNFHPYLKQVKLFARVWTLYSSKLKFQTIDATWRTLWPKISWGPLILPTANNSSSSLRSWETSLNAWALTSSNLSMALLFAFVWFFASTLGGSFLLKNAENDPSEVVGCRRSSRILSSLQTSRQKVFMSRLRTSRYTSPR